MNEKTEFANVDYAAHKEQTYHDEAPARQASVALNVVDNPLRVRNIDRHRSEKQSTTQTLTTLTAREQGTGSPRCPLFRRVEWYGRPGRLVWSSCSCRT